MIEKSRYFYNASNETIRCVPGSWPDAMRASQIKFLTACGYAEIVDYDPPKSQMPIAMVRDRIERVEDGAYHQIVDVTPLPVKLSQEKLLAHPAIAPRITELMESIGSDAQLTDWWCNDLRYLRGSDMAQRAMALFGMDQNQIEQVVKECMA